MVAARPDRIIAWIFPVLVVFSLWAVAGGWTHNLLDAHSFRQTQTALSSYYMLKGGPLFAYETPIFGPPWSIPFEFPLYQALVAWLAAKAPLTLESAGRLVSVVFFYFTLIPLFDLLRPLLPAAHHRLIALSLVLSSPLYLFWSRAFMMESTALFFVTSYFALVVRFLRRPAAGLAVLAIAAGTIGGLVKITTLFPFLIATGAVTAHTVWRQRRFGARYLTMVVCFFVIPIAVSIAWTRYAEHLRALNPFAVFNIKSELNLWLFGSFQQRIAPPTWNVFLVRTIEDVCGSLAFFFSAIVIVRSPNHTYRLVYLLCVVVYLAEVLTFTNLHIVHEYYIYGGGLFLIVAESVAVVSLLEGPRWQPLAGATLAVALVGLSVAGYLTGYRQLQERESPATLLPLAHDIASISSLNDVVIVYGQGWSPELPYYAGRRALLVFHPSFATPETVSAAKSRIEALGLHAGPLVICGMSERVHTPFVELWGFDPMQGTPLRYCRVYR